jgi:hypothetical protein
MSQTISERLQNGEKIYLNPSGLEQFAVYSTLIVGAILLSTQLGHYMLGIGAVLLAIVGPFSYFTFIRNKKYITLNGAQVFNTWIAWKDVVHIEYNRANESATTITFIIHSATAKVIIPIRALYQDEMIAFFNFLPQLKFVVPTDWRLELGEWVKK